MKRKLTKLTVILPLIALFIIFIPMPTNASWSATGIMTSILGWLIGDVFLPFMGKIMVIITNGIISVASYNGFADATAVQIGWVLLRDVANMIFVVALLMMAFGTMLDIEALGNTHNLAKLVIMAIAVNFSKTLTLFLIDIGQVVMLTFVAAFQSTAAGNFIKAFGLEDWMKLAGEQTDNGIILEVIIGMILAAVLVTVATGVLIVFLGYLLARLAMLWILIIFSPLVFGLAVLGHAGQEFYAKWWKELKANIIAGPLIAFFLWLTLLVAGSSMGGSIGNEIMLSGTIQSNTSDLAQANINSPVKSAAFSLDVLVTFIISILMLLLGLKITEEVGAGAAMSVGKGLKGKVAGAARWGLKKAGKAAWWGTKKTGGVLANIPLGKGKASLAGYASGIGSAITGSKIGQAFGLSKEHTELVRAERKARGLRAMGQETKARSLEQEVIAGQRKKLDSLTQDQVEEKMKKMRKNGDTSSLEYKAMGLDLASRGYFNTNHPNLDKVASGDLEFKKDLIKAANDKGANYVDVKGGNPERTVRDMMAGKTDNELRAMFATIDKGVQKTRDIDGNETIGDQYATNKLLNLEKKSFDTNSFGEPARKKVLDALMLAMKNEKDPSVDPKSKRAALLKKYNELSSGPGNAPNTATISASGDIMGVSSDVIEQQREMYESQQKSIRESYTDELRKQNGTIVPVDQEIIDAAAFSMDEPSKERIRLVGNDLQTMTNNLSTPTQIHDAEMDTQTFENELRAQYQKLDARGLRTGKTDKDGRELSYTEVFDSSSLNSSITEMREKLRELQNPALLLGRRSSVEKEIQSIQNLINSMTQQMMSSGVGRAQGGTERSSYERIVVKKMPKMDSKINVHMSNAGSETDALKKEKQMILARKEMEKAVNELATKEVGLVEAVKNEFITLKDEIEKLKINDGTGDLKTKLDELKRLHEQYEKLRKKK